MNTYLITTRNKSFPNEVALTMVIKASSPETARDYFNSQIAYHANWEPIQIKTIGVDTHAQATPPYHHNV